MNKGTEVMKATAVRRRGCVNREQVQDDNARMEELEVGIMRCRV